jgi:hypothetical protein
MAKSKVPFRIGTGAGFSADRLRPAVDLVEHGNLDVLVLECLGERTVAFAHRDRMLDPRKGYNAHLERRMRALLPVCRATKTRIVTNFGAANPRAAALRTLEIARELGLAGLKVACVEGDDVSSEIALDTPLMDETATLRDIGMPMVGANAYIGADALLPALEECPDIIIGGRFADPSMFLAPLMCHFGWTSGDTERLGAGTLVGHLMECGMQVSGGYFADPGKKDVHDLARCGYPIAEVSEDGGAVITKLTDSGGCVTTATVKEQLLYEVHDPAAYLTPDVTADFSKVSVVEEAADRVRVSNAGGRQRPAQLKVTVGFDAGYVAEAGVSYAGTGARERGELAAAIVRDRMSQDRMIDGALRTDLIGVGSLFASAGARAADSEDVRLHVTLRTREREAAELMLWEVEALLCCGPAGGGGYRGMISPAVITKSALIGRDRVKTGVEVMTA